MIKSENLFKPSTFTFIRMSFSIDVYALLGNPSKDSDWITMGAGLRLLHPQLALVLWQGYVLLP